MQTIFITSFHPHVSRNILLSDAFSLLKSNSDLRIVVICPDYKKDYFEKTFRDKNVIIEGFGLYKSSRTFWGLFFKRFSRTFFNTGTTRGKRKYKYYWDRKFFYFFGSNIVSFFGKSFFLQRLVRSLDFKLSPKNYFSDLINKYKPDAVLLTDIHNENDVALGQDARRNGIKIMGMWRSWDNPTQQMLRIFPDVLFAGSEELKKETVALDNFPSEKIIVTGHPHYDRYLKGPSRSKEKFYEDFGLNPARPFILFAPGGDKIIHYNDTDIFALEILNEMGMQVIVRYPPGEDVKLIDEKKWPSSIVFDKTGIRFSSRPGDLEIRKEDDINLIDEISYAAMVITGPTSLPLDASLLDKPSIVADIYPTPRNEYGKGWGYLLDHIYKLFSTGGTWHTETKEDFMKAVNAYLGNPSLHKEGRKKIREMWFSDADGNASKRLYEAILAFMKK